MESLAWCVATVAALALCVLALPVALVAWPLETVRGALHGAD